jgi:hypothetical protein
LRRSSVGKTSIALRRIFVRRRSASRTPASSSSP